jgi:hypothetical protein
MLRNVKRKRKRLRRSLSLHQWGEGVEEDLVKRLLNLNMHRILNHHLGKLLGLGSKDETCDPIHVEKKLKPDRCPFMFYNLIEAWRERPRTCCHTTTMPTSCFDGQLTQRKVIPQLMFFDQSPKSVCSR